MRFDLEKVAHTFAFDALDKQSLHDYWLRLLDIAVWGSVQSSKIGALPRARKRLLELGEELCSFYASKEWIPQPREQLKSALGSSVKLRDTLLSTERSVILLDSGDDKNKFDELFLAFRKQLLPVIEKHEALWAELLESQLDEPETDD